MRRGIVVGASLGLAVLVAAFAAHEHGIRWRHGDPPSALPGIPDDPPWVPVNGQPDRDPPPRALRADPDPGRINTVAHQAHTRAGAEQFALLAAQLFTDARRSDPDPRALIALESSRMARPMRDFLAVDATDQRKSGLERHYDTKLDMWIRSEPVGPVSAPSRVNVEVAGNNVSVPLDFHAWYRDRYDVVWESGRWALIGYGGGVFGPDSSTNLTREQQKAFLTGPGWRRIPAGSG